MKFENTKVFNFEGAFRGLRNPKNSWKKSDSEFATTTYQLYDGDTYVADLWMSKYHSDLNWPEELSDQGCQLAEKYCNKLLSEGILEENCDCGTYAFIGPNDMHLAQSLIKAGPEHRKFLRQIFVSVDITAPLYWFKQLDTYKIGTTANSTSTMHKITSEPITLDCFETDDMSNIKYYHGNTTDMFAELIIEQLEFLRQKYLETKDKKYWKELIRWLPESWLQTRTWTADYETIRAICQQRRNHKLNEWSGKDNPDTDNFIAWARTLPYAQYLIFDDENIPFQIEK